MPLKTISMKLQLKATPREPMVWSFKAKTALFTAIQIQSHTSHNSTPSLCYVFCLLVLCVHTYIIIYTFTYSTVHPENQSNTILPTFFIQKSQITPSKIMRQAENYEILKTVTLRMLYFSSATRTFRLHVFKLSSSPWQGS